MAGSARVGIFQGPATPYGIAIPTIHPRDNDITPDPRLAEKERLQALEDELYFELQNQRRDYTKRQQTSGERGLGGGSGTSGGA